MSTPFDATTKELVRFHPEDWLALLGLPPAPCELIDADLATVSTEADRLIEVHAEPPYLVHIEFQAGHDGRSVPGRMLRYNVLASEQTGRVVLSYVILLRPEADSPVLTGSVERFRPDGTRFHWFEFGAVRLWRFPVDRLLRGGLATLPLALLCDLSGISVEAVVERLEERLTHAEPLEDRRKLWTSTYLLAGLRHSSQTVGKMLAKAVAQMKESTTYQEILAEGRVEGRVEGERILFLKFARRRLGEPDAAVLTQVEAASPVQIERWAEALDQVETWADLLLL